jgi:hypothetical protein
MRPSIVLALARFLWGVRFAWQTLQLLSSLRSTRSWRCSRGSVGLEPILIRSAIECFGGVRFSRGAYDNAVGRCWSFVSGRTPSLHSPVRLQQIHEPRQAIQSSSSRRRWRHFS